MIGQILLLAAGFLVLVAVSVSSVVLVNTAREDNSAVVHTVEVENQISTLLLEIRRAESAARAYLLTAAPQFLAEHQAAIAAILPAVDKLVALDADNPVQVENAGRLRAAIESRLAEFARGNRSGASATKSRRRGTRCCAKPAPARPSRSSAKSQRNA